MQIAPISHVDGNSLYRQMLMDLLDGEKSAPRGRPIREIRPGLFAVARARDAWITDPARKLSMGLAYVESFQLVSGISTPAQLVAVAPNYAQFINPETQELDGAYPPRIISQISWIRHLLRKDPDTRQAVISVYDKRDLHESRDIPCTLSLQFLQRNGELELQVNMRSSDCWLGIPYDFAQFSLLQLTLAADLGIPAGRFMLIAGSSHIYERDVPKICDYLEDTCLQHRSVPVDLEIRVPRAGEIRLGECTQQAAGALYDWWYQPQRSGIELRGIFKQGYDYLMREFPDGQRTERRKVRVL